MIPQISLRAALAAPELLGHALPGDSWHVWRILLIAAMGDKLTDEERITFKQFTGRDHEPGVMVEELCVVKGRRAGASHASGKVVIPYLAGLCKHPALARGERGILLVVAQDQRTADGILDYAEAAFRDSPVLAQLIETRNARELILNNGITIEVRAADSRRLRGLTFIGGIGDEIAHWPTGEDAANPDDEIINAAIRPGLSTIGGPLFLLSTPYARRGVLWDTFNKHFGPNGDPRVLVAHGSTLDFHPGFPVSVIDRALARDASQGSSEYLALFRTDVESAFNREVIEANVPKGVFERPHETGKRYIAFTDPSGGGSDSFTLAIAHRNADNSLVLDLLREIRPPLSPEQVTADFSGMCKAYGVNKIIGDNYAKEWPQEAFRRHGITYEVCKLNKSELYLHGLALLNSRRAELLDHSRLISQLVRLERRTGRGGRDNIDKPSGEHDDVANAAIGALVVALRAQRNRLVFRGYNPYGSDRMPLMEMSDGEWHEVNGQSRIHLVRDRTGNLQLRGGDNSAWPTRQKN